GDASTGFDTLSGIEVVLATGFDDVLIASSGNETFYGAGGNDIVDYGAFSTAVVTTLDAAGSVVLTVAGDATPTRVRGPASSAGNGWVLGDGGTNRLYGNAGDDSLSGAAGDDTIYGGLGADWLGGGTGNDTLYGGVEDDTFVGGAGTDTMFGDAGSSDLVDYS